MANGFVNVTQSHFLKLNQRISEGEDNSASLKQ
jgi:hypothetical protein